MPVSFFLFQKLSFSDAAYGTLNFQHFVVVFCPNNSCRAFNIRCNSPIFPTIDVVHGCILRKQFYSTKVDKNIGNGAWVQLSEFVQNLFCQIKNRGVICRDFFLSNTKDASICHYGWSVFFFLLFKSLHDNSFSSSSHFDLILFLQMINNSVTKFISIVWLTHMYDEVFVHPPQ